MRDIVESDDDGVVANADISVDSSEDGRSKMGSIPGGKWISESFSELVTHSLSNERHGHLAKANVEIHRAGAFPAERLIGVEEFFDVPTLRVIDGQVNDLIPTVGSQKGFMVEFVRVFAGALDKLAVGIIRVFFEVERPMSGCPPSPLRLKLLLRDGL